MDKLNQNNQPFSDGVFDFVPITLMETEQNPQVQSIEEMDDLLFNC